MPTSYVTGKYIARDAAIEELEGFTGRLLAPEAIHELDLRAIYETTVGERQEVDDKVAQLEADLDDLRDDRGDLEREVDDLKADLHLAHEALRRLVEINYAKKGKRASELFYEICDQAREALRGNHDH